MTKFITWHKVLLRNISSRSVVEWSVTYRSTRIKSLRNNGKTNTLETQLSYFRWAVIHLRQFQGCIVLINIKKMISKERGTIILSITLLTVQTSLGIMSK